MRILLLGKGLLGKQIIDGLGKKEGYRLFSFGHGECDVRDAAKIAEIIEAVKPHYVVNATGYTAVDHAQEERTLAFEINGYAVGVLAKICGDKKIPIIHFSTDYIFSGANEDGYEENAPYEIPLNIYGQSKLLGEKLLMENTPYFFLIRSQWLYGKGGKNFIDAILEQAKTKQTLRVVNDQFGKPTFADDLVKALLPFFESDKYGIYHIVNEGVTTWFDYAKEIVKLMGLQNEVIPITSEELNRPAKRPKFSALKNTKLPLLRHWKKALKDYLISTSLRSPL